MRRPESFTVVNRPPCVPRWPNRPHPGDPNLSFPFLVRPLHCRVRFGSLGSEPAESTATSSNSGRRVLHDTDPRSSIETGFPFVMVT